MNAFETGLYDLLRESQILRDEPMKKHTTFRAGGPAAWYVTPEETGQLRDLIRLCREQKIPFYILGNGSNLLVSDGGYDGVVIAMCRGFGEISTGNIASSEASAEAGVDQQERNTAVSGNGDRMRKLQEERQFVITAGAGVLLSAVAKQALDMELCGMEFAAGIPGSVGGAVVMNAGAYGSEMKDVLRCVRVLTRDGEIRELSVDELKLGYRKSCIRERGYVVLEAEYALTPGRREEIRARMEELAARRREKQPLEYPSAGSTFKRPEGHFAGKLIQDAGLCGYRIGGAQVSEKHCGFVINRDHASAADIWRLCKMIRNAVYEKFGVELEPEVETLGEFDE